MNNTVLLVGKCGLGTTLPEDAPFGTEMLDNFFHSLEQQPQKPAAICFFTEGVKLVADDSPLLLSLRLLASLGIRLLVCKSCLAHYGLQDRVAVGEPGGMNDIVGLMTGADKVITL